MHLSPTHTYNPSLHYSLQCSQVISLERMWWKCQVSLKCEKKCILFTVYLLHESPSMISSSIRRSIHIQDIQTLPIWPLSMNILLLVLWNIVRETFKLWGLIISLQECWLVAEIQFDGRFFSKVLIRKDWSTSSPTLQIREYHFLNWLRFTVNFSIHWVSIDSDSVCLDQLTQVQC